MKITLVIPPSPFLIDDRVFPFLGPLQIAAVARELGHDVRVCDLTGYKRRNGIKHADFDTVIRETTAELLSSLDGSELIGFYSLAAQHPQVVQLHNAVKEAHPECITALGGPHANTTPDKCLADGFDYVVASDQGGGGGEPGFIELLDRIGMPRKKQGLNVINSNERIIRAASRLGTTWENDRWPLPARDLIDIRDYIYEIEGARATSIVSATGCPFACTYCSHWSGYRKLEAKSAPRVRQEICEVKALGFDAVMFYDDEINLRPDFGDDFLQMLTQQNITWRAFFKNGKHLTVDDVFKKMAAAGCVQLCTGAESADPKILRDIKKGATLDDNTQFIKLCVKHGIKPKVFTQVGLPGETPDTVKALRDWLVEMAGLGLADADVSITTPYEGTPIYDTPEKFDIKFDKDELDYSSESILYKGVPGEYKSYVWHDNLTKHDIVAARQWVEDEFRIAAGLQPLLAKDDG